MRGSRGEWGRLGVQKVYFEKILWNWTDLGSLLYIYPAREDSVPPWMQLQRQFFNAQNQFLNHETSNSDLGTIR